ncbi:hypothetical protein [Rhizobium cauense]|nr:hypothetical protein [Rhizobium cauense]
MLDAYALAENSAASIFVCTALQIVFLSSLNFENGISYQRDLVEN